MSRRKISVDVLMIASLPVYLGAGQHSGLGNVVWGLARALTKVGASFAIAARGKYFVRYREIEGVRIFGLGFDLLALLRWSLVVVRNLKDIMGEPDAYFRRRLLYALYFLAYMDRRIDFKILHMHHVTNQMPLAARMLGLRQPILGHIHSYSNLHNTSDEGQRQVVLANINRQMDCIDAVIHVSRSVRQQGQDYGVVWKVPEVVIHNGLDLNIPAATSLDRPRVIGFVGAFLEIKGIRTLLESLPGLESEVDRVVWIGGGPLETEIRQVAQKIGIPFEFHAFLDHAELMQQMKKFKVLVVPSSSESFGQVYIEALINGTAVIGYGPIIEEFRTDFEFTGEAQNWLIPFYHGQSDLQDQIRKTLDQVYQEFDYQRARRLILEKLDWHNLVSEYSACYSRLLTISNS